MLIFYRFRLKGRLPIGFRPGPQEVTMILSQSCRGGFPFLRSLALALLLLGAIGIPVRAQYFGTTTVVTARCGNCKMQVSAAAQVGMNCPFCGVHWGSDNLGNVSPRVWAAAVSRAHAEQVARLRERRVRRMAALARLSAPREAPATPGAGDKGQNDPDRQMRINWAKNILCHPGIELSRHGGGEGAADSAYQNVKAAERGMASGLGGGADSPGGSVRLDLRMLRGLNAAARLYPIRVAAIAGGEHPAGSPHHRGLAFDVDRINGQVVTPDNPYLAEFAGCCRRLGASVASGADDTDHPGSLHVEWPPAG
jgi:hypothetical protein